MFPARLGVEKKGGGHPKVTTPVGSAGCVRLR